MAEYQFEMIASFSDLFTIDADSYDEAMSLAREEAESYYPVIPEGFAGYWDNVEVNCVSEPEED